MIASDVASSIEDGSSAGESTADIFLSVLDQHSNRMRMALASQQKKYFPPDARKKLRSFTSGEAAKLLGTTDANLRALEVAEKIERPETTETGRRLYSADSLNRIRVVLEEARLEALRAQRRPAQGENQKQTRSHIKHRRPGEILQIVAVTNFKGGSGKTTSSIYLAEHLALRGYRVLAIDLDPQASLSSMLGHQQEIEITEGETIYGAIRYDKPRRPMREIIRSTYFPNLDLCPGGLELMEFEQWTAVCGLNSESRVEGITGEPGIFFVRVADAIAQVEKDYDVVVMDCPPSLGFLTLSALCAANGLLIPVHPEMLDVASMCQFLSMAHVYLDTLRQGGAMIDYRWMRYLATRFESSDSAQAQMMVFLRQMFGDLVLSNEMVKSAAISNAGLTQQTIYELERKELNRSTYDRAVDSLDAVNEEIEGILEEVWGR